jgi:hypothetical protein
MIQIVMDFDRHEQQKTEIATQSMLKKCRITEEHSTQLLYETARESRTMCDQARASTAICWTL